MWPGLGLKTVYIKFRNASGGSIVKTGTITLVESSTGSQADISGSGTSQPPAGQVLGEQCVNTIEVERLVSTKSDANLIQRLKGQILLQVEERGEAWYVDPVSKFRYYLPNGAVAYRILELLGLGITDENLSFIPIGLEPRFKELDSDNDGLGDKLEESIGTKVDDPDSDQDGISDGEEIKQGLNPLLKGAAKLPVKSALVNRLRGRILLQIKALGQAWFIYPPNGQRYYMHDGDSALQIMRYLGYGINNADLRKIPVAEYLGKVPYASLACGLSEAEVQSILKSAPVAIAPAAPSPAARVLGESTKAVTVGQLSDFINQSFAAKLITTEIVRSNLIKEIKYVGVQAERIRSFRMEKCQARPACLANMDKQKQELFDTLYTRIAVQKQHGFITDEGYVRIKQRLKEWFDSI